MEEVAENANAFDPDAQQLGKSYATALLSAAEKAGNLEQVVDELESFVDDVLLPMPRLAAALESPRVPQEAKLSMLEKAIAGKVSREFYNFLRVVARHGRFDCLGAIRKEARRQLNERLGRVEVRLRSAFALDEGLLRRIAQRLEQAIGSRIDLKPHVDPELIGGLEIRIGDTVYDGTIVRQLSRLREQAVRKARDEIRHRGERFTTA